MWSALLVDRGSSQDLAQANKWQNALASGRSLSCEADAEYCRLLLTVCRVLADDPKRCNIEGLKRLEFKHDGRVYNSPHLYTMLQCMRLVLRVLGSLETKDKKERVEYGKLATGIANTLVATHWPKVRMNPNLMGTRFAVTKWKQHHARQMESWMRDQVKQEPLLSIEYALALQALVQARTELAIMQQFMEDAQVWRTERQRGKKKKKKKKKEEPAPVPPVEVHAAKLYGGAVEAWNRFTVLRRELLHSCPSSKSWEQVGRDDAKKHAAHFKQDARHAYHTLADALRQDFDIAEALQCYQWAMASPVNEKEETLFWTHATSLRRHPLEKKWALLEEENMTIYHHAPLVEAADGRSDVRRMTLDALQHFELPRVAQSLLAPPVASLLATESKKQSETKKSKAPVQQQEASTETQGVNKVKRTQQSNMDEQPRRQGSVSRQTVRL